MNRREYVRAARERAGVRVIYSDTTVRSFPTQWFQFAPFWPGAS